MTPDEKPGAKSGNRHVDCFAFVAPWQDYRLVVLVGKVMGFAVIGHDDERFDGAEFNFGVPDGRSSEGNILAIGRESRIPFAARMMRTCSGNVVHVGSGDLPQFRFRNVMNLEVFVTAAENQLRALRVHPDIHRVRAKSLMSLPRFKS